jgi:outer membrane immunogenic protein
MKKLLLSAVALAVVTVGPALAADLPRKAPRYQPPPPPPVLSWTGFYVGLNAGATWGCGSASNTVTPTSVDLGFPHNGNLATTNAHLSAISAAGSFDHNNGCRDANFIGGGQIGYNWQFTNWLAGIEADFQGIGGNNNDNVFVNVVPVGPNDPSNWVGTVGFNRDHSWLGTVRGRIGFLATPAFLIYATGGAAYGNVSGDLALDLRNDVYVVGNHIPANSAFASIDKTRWGWTAGGGVEWMFAPQWSVKAEYLYYDLGSRDLDFPFTVHDNQTGLNATFNSQTTIDFKGHIARVGVNWHFNP